MISVEDYSFRYNHATRFAVQHLSFRYDTPSVLTIAGRSAAGKTTLLYEIAGLLEKHFSGGSYSGLLKFTDPVGRLDPSKIGFVFQDVRIQLSGITETVEEEIAFALEQFGLPQQIIVDRVEEQIENFRLDALRRRHPRSLSGGETQMVALASETAKHPAMLILDEPFQGLDAKNMTVLLDSLDSLKDSTTIIIADEGIDSARRLGGRVLLLDKGSQLFFGTLPELLRSGSGLSLLDLPDWIEAQRLMGRPFISTNYRESVQWLKNPRSSK
ncbi:MAG TPA: ABC transporter ATP-binding protein [Bacteroidota bacterium]|nr:ABC transporter ATP-binding protein [Bacteroidota bacterium]